MICGISIGSWCESARRTLEKSRNYWKFLKTRERSTHLPRSGRLYMPPILIRLVEMILHFIEVRFNFGSTSFIQNFTRFRHQDFLIISVTFFRQFQTKSSCFQSLRILVFFRLLSIVTKRTMHITSEQKSQYIPTILRL
jgi:hypothetical protein